MAVSRQSNTNDADKEYFILSMCLHYGFIICDEEENVW